MNIGGGYLQPSPFQGIPGGPVIPQQPNGGGGSLLAAMLAHLIGSIGQTAPAAHVVNPQMQAQDNYVAAGPLGGWGAVSRGAVPVPQLAVHRSPIAAHLQPLPELIGDNGYTHPVLQYLGRH